MSKRSTNSADWVRSDIEQRGAQIAYETLLEIALDKTAPAPARATAGVAVLRVGGLLDAKKNPRDVEPSEMNGIEMLARLQSIVESGEAELRQIDAMAAARRGELDDDDPEGDEPNVFD